MGKYDVEHWKIIMDVTQSNYSNMLKRLRRKLKISNFILVYYSIALIVYTLTNKYFPEYYNSILSEYFSIIVSIIILVYSLINNSANYSVRIVQIEKSLNGVKDIKRTLNEEGDCSKQIKLYTELTNNTEKRENVDFFITIKNLCKEYGVNWFKKTKKTNKHSSCKFINKTDSRIKEEKIINYLSEINVIHEEFKVLWEYIWTIVIFLIPIVILALCFIIKDSNI